MQVIVVRVDINGEEKLVGRTTVQVELTTVGEDMDQVSTALAKAHNNILQVASELKIKDVKVIV